MVAMATVHPKALDRNALYKSVRKASGKAIAQAFGEE